jgi:hypothetical protein
MIDKKSGIGILTALIGLAALSVLISNRSTTVAVIQTGASALGNLLGVVVAPIQSKPAASAPGTSGVAGAVGGLQSIANLLPSALSASQAIGNTLQTLAGF